MHKITEMEDIIQGMEDINFYLISFNTKFNFLNKVFLNVF